MSDLLMKSLTQRIIHLLYRYESLTVYQIWILTGYARKTIEKHVSDMTKEGLIKRLRIPMIEQRSTAFHLTPETAEWAGTCVRERRLFRAKQWDGPPGSIVQLLIGNQYVTELIRATQNDENNGVYEWLGRVGAADMYTRYEEDKKIPGPDYNSYVVFHYEGKKYIFHLDIISGNESFAAIEELFIDFQKSVIESNQWSDLESVNYQLICYGKEMREKLLKLWYGVAGKRSVPFLSVANYQDIATQGVFAPVWMTAEKGMVSLRDLPSLNTVDNVSEFMSKERPDPAGSGENAVLPGFQGFFSPESEEQPSEPIQSSDKKEENTEKEESVDSSDDVGIAWTIPK
ncbi:hypothetical protein P4S91_04625 [Aneurinibacillus aneurinilyticus]|uniref:hypothetical protein n=1 Tax=Aneurinibacillus aneurinilyticus TaxID=1391 RepID=UPI002E1DDCAF|nr:hypothetical protein [Aneurinibacillus aneurinilyticus]MED0722216.1 hypothetical protein [Aneurinibacillus aneurinilyticus]